MSSEKRTAYEKIVYEYIDDLNRYALWLCKNPTLAKDLVQETFLRAWKSFDKLREQKAAKSWLITILRREYARTFERKVPDFANFDDLELEDQIEPDPDDRAEVRLMRKAMLNLDQKYREPIILQVIGGFSCDEIAEILGITRSAVMTQLFRARQKIKDNLQVDEEP
ncbi:MAG: sigma-70 family RNA polymerase sigma factor [Xanthomonadales bacterium]|nr:sigma-70 family RNA polymerase sigma factor [Xanthomonadales bacterium]